MLASMTGPKGQAAAAAPVASQVKCREDIELPESGPESDLNLDSESDSVADSDSDSDSGSGSGSGQELELDQRLYQITVSERCFFQQRRLAHMNMRKALLFHQTP